MVSDRAWRLSLRSAVIALVSSALAASAGGAAPSVQAQVSPAPAEGGVAVATTASHRTRRHHRASRRPRVVYRWTVGWGPYWGPYWGGYWYGPGWERHPRAGSLFGALDTDVSPERAEIWVDGRRVGVADEFDGFPDYLWLEKGTYDVVIYLPGFQTIARQYTIYPGLVIDVEDRMVRGEAVHPDDLASTSHERRDERLRRDRENRERLERRATEEWLDVREAPGKLVVRVVPADASVYLDGRFVGTGGDLARLRSGLLVDSGSHLLEVVRPGFAEEIRTVEVGVGEDLEIDVELVEDDGDAP